MSPTIIDLRIHPAPFVTVSELAAYWGVSERTIYRDLEKGALRFVRVGSAGNIRIPIAAARGYGRPDDPEAKSNDQQARQL